MKHTVPIPRVSETAPEMVRRFGLIMAGLAALVARRFLRDPKFGQVLVPLWGWLNRTVQRFGRVQPGVTRRRVARAAAPGVVRAERVRLPGGRGWLVMALGWEAAGSGSQLQALLAEPEMQALLAAMPGMARVLRPVCRMLLLEEVAAVALPVRVRVRPERAPKPKRERVRLPREPRSWWPLRMQKYGKT